MICWVTWVSCNLDVFGCRPSSVYNFIDLLNYRLLRRIVGQYTFFFLDKNWQYTLCSPLSLMKLHGSDLFVKWK